MFDRYTDRARRAVVLADQEARLLGHDTVDTGHLLLGLIGEGGGVAFTALDALGVTPPAAQKAVLARQAAGCADPKGHRAFTSELKKALERGQRESIMLGCPYVGTEHLLLGLIAEGSDIGALALADCGIADGDRGLLADVRAKVLELLDGYAKPTASPVTAGDSLEEFALRLVDGWGEAVSAYLDRMVPLIRSVAELVKDPQVQAALAARELGVALREYRPCHCFCGHTHPSAKGVCDMRAVASRHYDTPTIGPVDVPLCGPCATAQGIAVPA